jgi:hypothetical protein
MKYGRKVRNETGQKVGVVLRIREMVSKIYSTNPTVERILAVERRPQNFF